jgi:osmotically-inducible protein OsmY
MEHNNQSSQKNHRMASANRRRGMREQQGSRFQESRPSRFQNQQESQGGWSEPNTGFRGGSYNDSEWNPSWEDRDQRYGFDNHAEHTSPSSYGSSYGSDSYETDASYGSDSRQGNRSSRYGQEQEGAYSYSGQQYGNSGQQYGNSSQYSNQGQFKGVGPKGYKRSDERIKEDACECLARHAGIDASSIEVEVENGEVTLMGTVENRQAKRLIEDALEDVSGVVEIHNQLRLNRSEGSGSTELGKTSSKSESSRSESAKTRAA